MRCVLEEGEAWLSAPRVGFPRDAARPSHTSAAAAFLLRRVGLHTRRFLHE